MQLFIVWSGRTSEAIATALRDWLPDVINSIQPFASLVDMDAGSRWRTEVGTKLKEADFGIVCLTPSNLNSRWLNFEAGAISKALDEARVIPLLHDLANSDVRGPLAQFQMKMLDKRGVFETLATINKALVDSLPQARLERSFEVWWPSLEEKLSRLPSSDTDDAETGKPEDAKIVDILDELLTTTRAIDRQINRSPIRLPGLSARQVIHGGSTPKVYLGGRFRLSENAQSAIGEIIQLLPDGRVDGWDYRDRELVMQLSMDELTADEEQLIRNVCARHNVTLMRICAGDP